MNSTNLVTINEIMSAWLVAWFKIGKSVGSRWNDTGKLQNLLKFVPSWEYRYPDYW